MTTAEKGEAFRALHEGDPFVIPNPWDAGSARVLEALGFPALATTSSGFAFTLGRLDGAATLEEVVAHVRVVAAAVDVPLSVDLENGYGEGPERAVAAVAEAGAGGAPGAGVRPGGGGLPPGVAGAGGGPPGAGGARGGVPLRLAGRARDHHPPPPPPR